MMYNSSNHHNQIIMAEILGLALFIGAIVVLRIFGAWMFRINDVIKLQKEILTELKQLNSSQNNFN